MRSTRPLAPALLTALVLLAGCGGDDETSSSTTTSQAAATSTTVAATSTTRSPDALKAALLTQADVPGSTVSTSPPSDADFSACFPGNPLGGKDFPNEVESPDLELTQGTVQRQYTSGARQATPDQARDFVTTFSSEPGSQCVLNAFKTFISSPPNPLDASGLTAKVSSASIADAGGVLSISGNLKSGAESVPIAADLVAFRKGPIVVLLSVGSVQGPTAPGQAVELAQKIAGRLS